MRIATALIAPVVIVLGTGIVLAQSDPIKTRQHLMKENDKNFKVLVPMVRGQAPFDAKAVAAAFDQWADTAKQLPGLFPDNSKTGERTRASPKIWANKNDFDAKAAALGKAVAAHRAGAVASLGGLKAAIPAIGDACDDCHKAYRLSRH